MKTFIIKIILFSLPVFLIFIFPITILCLSKEYSSMNYVVNKQSENPNVIFGFSYNGISFIPYKNLLVKKNNPEVITLGTSRVMQIRKEFFHSNVKFVNAGGAGKNLGDMEIFIKDLPDNGSIKFIVLGFDQGVFYKSSYSTDIRSEDNSVFNFIHVTCGLMRRIYLDYFAKKYFISDLIIISKQTKNIGMSAILHGDGFRSDGSYVYNQASLDKSLHENVQSQIIKENSFIDLDKHSLSKEEKANFNKNLSILNSIFKIAKSKNITIVGIMPPMPKEIYEKYLNSDGYYKDSVTIVPEELSKIFNSNGLSFYNFSSILSFGGKETEFVDSKHGTDLIYAKALKYISDNSDNNFLYLDNQYLSKIIKNSKGDFLGF